VTAGSLKHRMRFEQRITRQDDLGNARGGFVAQFTAWAGLKPLRGSETVIASRMAGVQPVIITVRDNRMAREINTGWRAVDERDGVVYDIQSIADMEDDRKYLTLMAQSGAGQGDG
jgi:head-tail adaptor